MNKFLTSLLLVPALIAVVVGAIWYFGYVLDPEIPGVAVVEGLTGEVTTEWTSDGVLSIHARNEVDFFRGLGYSHATRAPWQLFALRRTALGELSSWFGQEAIEIDAASKMLGFGRLGIEAYSQLDEPTRHMLEAYAQGINAALRGHDVGRIDPFIAIRRDPERWEPWHTLAVERLIAWIATEIVISPESSLLPKEVSAFLATSHLYREWLHLDGFENSMTLVLRSDDVTHFFHRLVTGRSATPYLMDVEVAFPDGVMIAGTSFVGAPGFIVGKTLNRAWGVLPHALATVERVGWRGDGMQSARVTSDGETEHLVTFRHVDDRLLFVNTETDSLWSMRWIGLTPVSDAANWLRLLHDQPPQFNLNDGTGVLIERSGVWTALGSSRWQHRLSGGLLISHSIWRDYVADRLSQLVRTSETVDLETWMHDAYSLWAAEVTPDLLSNLDGSSSDPQLDAAITYLRNWDFRFSGESIAASIFDAWATAYWQVSGRLPGTPRSEGLAGGAISNTSLERAVEGLRTMYGPDLSTWRWEMVQDNMRRFPLEPLFEKEHSWMSRTRFAPINPVGDGHPSSLAWGSTSAEVRNRPPGEWEIWMSSSNWQTLNIRRDVPPAGQLSTNVREEDNISSTAAIPSDKVAEVTRLRAPGADRQR